MTITVGCKVGVDPGSSLIGSASEEHQIWRELTLADQLLMLQSASTGEHLEAVPNRAAPRDGAEALESVGAAAPTIY